MRSYFEGWYLKHQSETDFMALIPARHSDRNGKVTGSLQVITPEWSRQVSFDTVSYCRREGVFRLGESTFSRQGCQLGLRTPELTLTGTLEYASLTPPPGDVMGPFRWIPFLQCRHSVFSLHHRVDGAVTINGTPWRFRNAIGYWEGDRGRSFPKRYLWTQCSWGTDGVMLSVAEVPLCGATLTGTIALVWLEGKVYRLATYLGAKVVRVEKNRAELEQGVLRLTVEALEQQGKPLLAPHQGRMTRTIHESLTSTVRYRLCRGSDVLLDRTSDGASMEEMWL